MTGWLRQEQFDDETSSIPNHILSWKINLLLFGLLVLVVLAGFFWQLKRINGGFRSQVLSHSQMVAGIIEEKLQNSLLASQVIDETLQIFLFNSGKFVDYLDTIEPFNKTELASFAKESGLAGITILRSSGVSVTSADWLPVETNCNQKKEEVNYFPQSGLATLVYSKNEVSASKPSCLIVGIDVHRVQEFRQKSALTTLLSNLSALPGISYVKIEKDISDRDTDIQLVTGEHGLVAETRLSTRAGLLIVGLTADQYGNRVDELQKQFFLFAILLLTLGTGSSWLLYRYQMADINRTQRFERTMARQQEEAAMGRATATIAHEIRNPLNAINIGLQRLVMESYNLSGEQEQLLYSMRESVKRTESIISRLQSFTRPLTLESRQVQFSTLLDHVLEVYKPLCRQQSIQVESDICPSVVVNGDPDLIGELLDNLIKNSVEAQPNGGFLSVALSESENQALLVVKNGGFSLPEEMISKMTEPYFTTKTRGTGLGLALVKRIVDLHQGKIDTRKGTENDSLIIEVSLPQPADKQKNDDM